MTPSDVARRHTLVDLLRRSARRHPRQPDALPKNPSGQLPKRRPGKAHATLFATGGEA